MDVALRVDREETAQPQGRLKVLLEHLSYWPIVGDGVRLCRQRREQILYLVVGGWNTLFGYLVWAHEFLCHVIAGMVENQLFEGEDSAASARDRASR
jgi:hypothetical protein